MLAHCVFLKVRDDHDPADTERVLRELGEFAETVDGTIAYQAGPNRDYEHKTPDYPYGFVITFRDREAHLEYERHPTHMALGGQLVAMCEGGADGITVYDIEYG